MGFAKKNKKLAEAKDIFDQMELHGVSRTSWPLLKRENERGLLN
jgi:pentatricopeptide repeat protein